MNADAFQRLYEYHFAMNRQLWHHVSELRTRTSTGRATTRRVRCATQVWHLMTVDEGWFTQLRSDAWPDYLMPDVPQPLWSRDQIRERWDDVERRQREFLAAVTDAQLFEHPWAEGDDKDLVMWEVLFHVVNHGTDHRAQTQRLLSDLGVTTHAIDYVFFADEHPLP